MVVIKTPEAPSSERVLIALSIVPLKAEDEDGKERPLLWNLEVPACHFGCAYGRADAGRGGVRAALQQVILTAEARMGAFGASGRYNAEAGA